MIATHSVLLLFSPLILGAANEFLGGATGTLIGKQAYIAPEQFQGRATTQSDIYALGATLYFILSAQEPLPLSSSHPAKARTDISPTLDQLVAACTELETSKRIGSAEELLDLLNEPAHRIEITNQPMDTTTRTARGLESNGTSQISHISR